MDSIDIHTARKILLAAQDLDRLPRRKAAKKDVLAAIRRMGVLQIDTIHVIARSPYLVLWSRLGDYRPEWLDQLLAEGAIFESWAHALCFLPVEDFPLHRRRMLDLIQQDKWPVRWAVRFIREQPALIERVLSHMRENGGVRSAEFENKNRPPGGWWNWKEEKDALESLFLTGQAMIARREKFQRVYDLSERVLPEAEGLGLPSSEDLRRTLTLRAVHHLGVALPAWVPDYYRLPKMGIAAYLKSLAAEGLLRAVGIEGLKGPAYVHPERLGLLQKAASGKLEPELTMLLSPFDPLVWDRQRARDLFGFDYTIECYTPAAKRRYGYFTLPILHRGRLVGRLDPKAHRAQGLFEVKSIHLEPGVKATPELVTGLADTLRRLAAWHGTPDVVVRKSDPGGLAKKIHAKL